MISGLMSTGVFYYLDARNDQRYLQLMEIGTKLDPIYVSIESYKEQQRVKEIRDLENEIFELDFKEKDSGLSPLETALLSRRKSELLTLQSE